MKTQELEVAVIERAETVALHKHRKAKTILETRSVC